MTTVRVDRAACVGSGMCVLTAPDLFDQGEDDGLVVLRRADVAAGGRARLAHEAARLCPGRAIEVVR